METSKDWEAYLAGHKAAHLDRQIGVRLAQHFTDTDAIINPYTRQYSEGYQKGWACPCNHKEAKNGT